MADSDKTQAFNKKEKDRRNKGEKIGSNNPHGPGARRLSNSLRPANRYEQTENMLSFAKDSDADTFGSGSGKSRATGVTMEDKGSGMVLMTDEYGNKAHKYMPGSNDDITREGQKAKRYMQAEQERLKAIEANRSKLKAKENPMGNSAAKRKGKYDSGRTLVNK